MSAKMQNVPAWSTASGFREVTIVEIRNPVTHQKKSRSRYTDFEINLKTNSKAFTLNKSSVRRRYSDFVWLRSWLSANNEGFSSIRKTPPLPPKKLIGRFEKDFLEDRMRGLQRFLRKVLEHNVFLSDKALHLFLQSNLSIKQMENYLTGKPVESQDCVVTRRIMNCDENPTDGMEQRSLICRLSLKSSLENVSKMQDISEDSEHSSSSWEPTRTEEQSVIVVDDDMTCKTTDESEDAISDSENCEEKLSHQYGASSSSSAEGTSQGSSLTNSLMEDKQDSRCSENFQATEGLESSSSPVPIMCTFTSDSDSNDTTSDIGDPNSSFSIIESTPPIIQTILSRTIPSASSLPDTSKCGFIAAVPIIRSPSF